MNRTPSRLAALATLTGLLAGCQLGAVKEGTPHCDITPGSGDEVLIRAELILPDAPLPVSGELLVKGERIACVGTPKPKGGCAARAPDATRLDCPGALLSPGLINPHDHLGWSTSEPMPTDLRYDNRYQWQGTQGRKPPIRYGDGDYSKEALAWGEIRQLMAGTTSVAGSGGVPGLMRNLDQRELREGLPGTMSYTTFPWHNTDHQPITTDDCEPYDFLTPRELSDYNSFVPHVAEGVDPVANFFLQCLSGQHGQRPHGTDLEMEKSAFVHVIAADAGQVARMAERGTAWIWSPRSNVSLYGDTAALPLYRTLGVKMALSSDWTISGSMNLLRELRCADTLNRDYFEAPLSERQLLDMVTINAAEATHTAPHIGALRVGAYADLALFAPPAEPKRPYRAVLEAEPADVLMVMRGGTPLYGDDNVVTGLLADGAKACDTIGVCGSAKRFCLQSADISPDAQHILQLQRHLTTKLGKPPYPLLFCGPPEREPSCLPQRPGHYTGLTTPEDADGDGVANRVDNCPLIFNPVRLMDGGYQADYDEDGLGDPCDPTPLGEA